MRLFLISTLSFFCLRLFSQEIGNIVVEQDNDKVIIFYDLTGTSPDQVYTVVISCSVDGGTRFVLSSVSGDVGENISGGHHKKIVWDAFKDVNTLNQVQFFIRAEPDVTKVRKNEKEWIFGYYGSSTDFLGFRLGTLHKWGGYFSFKTYLFTDNSFILGLNKRINDYFYIYSGVGTGNWGWLYGNEDYWNKHYGIEFELGILAKYQHFYFTLGPTYLYGYPSNLTYDIAFGIGYSFTWDY
jgi:hypothetical protein